MRITRVKRILLPLLFFALHGVLVFAAVPGLINYQGKLTDSNGLPINGSYPITFSLYNVVSGGLSVWKEQRTIEVVDGIFQVQLGSVTPFAGNEFETANLYLEIEIYDPENGWEVLTPRQQLTSTPYAAKAANSDTLEGHNIADLDAMYVHAGDSVVTSAMIIDGSVGTLDLSDNSVSSAKIGASAVTSSHVADDSLTAADLAINSVGASEIAAGAVGSSEIANGSITATDIADGAVLAEILDDDGSKSGLDADMLDGSHASAFMSAGTDHWVNTTGDSMSGNLTITGEISAMNSSTSSYAGKFENSGQTQAWAMKGIASSTDSYAGGLVLDVDSTNGEAYGSTMQVDTSGRAYGLWIDSESTDADSLGIFIQNSVGADSTLDSKGIRANVLNYGTGDLFGIATYPVHHGTSGTTYGYFADVDGSSLGSAYGIYATAHDVETDAGGGVYGGYFFGNGARSNTYGVVAKASTSRGYATGIYAPVSLTTVDADIAKGADIDVYADSSSTGLLLGATARVEHAGTEGEVTAIHTDVYPSDTGDAYGLDVYVGGSYTSGNAYGIYSYVSNSDAEGSAYAGYFRGNVHVLGTLSKSGGSFKIDHPLDPENRYLQHSFVESPDMMNVYNGNVILGDQGEAWVQLPDYFEALNGNFRYQLTAVGGPGPNLHIAEEVSENRFKVGGGAPGLKVSWQITGIRHDAYAEAHPIAVEVDKDAKERGSYLNPDAFGFDETRSIDYARNSERIKERMKLDKGHMKSPTP